MAVDIKKLQEDLRRAGFLLVGTPDGDLGPKTAMAIREFQRYAGMPQIAQEDPSAPGSLTDRLTSVTNSNVYTGIAHGEPDAATLALLELWLKNNWRCPVVVQAWTLKKSGSGSKCDPFVPDHVQQGRENIWGFDEVKQTGPRMFVFDYTGYFTPLAPGKSPEKIALGAFTTSAFGNGPNAVPPKHVVRGDTSGPGMEVVPETLVGQSTITGATLSTFKVVRSVSEVECLGYFDAFNAYDTALLSVGLYNWTLGLKNEIGKAELAAYLAYLEEADAATFKKCVGVWGVGPLEKWKDTFDHSQRKYVARFGHLDSSGARVAIPGKMADLYRSWHWVYRFQAAARTVPAFRRKMWDMARFRIRDIRDTPFKPFAGSPLPAGAKVADVFTSERAMALLLRWHILFPGHVVSGGQTGAGLNDALKRANTPKLPADPTKWSDCHEERLLDGIRDKVIDIASKPLSETIDEIDGWPAWAAKPASIKVNPRCYRLDPTIGTTSVVRKSFSLDTSQLDALPASRRPDTAPVVPSARPAAIAAAEHAVLYGFDTKSSDAVFVVVSDGVTLRVKKSAPIASIDRFVLFEPDFSKVGDQQAALLTLAVIGPLDTLEVQNDGASNAVLIVKGKFRCWLPHDDSEETQKFEWRIRVKAGGPPQLEFAMLTFKHFAGGSLPVPFDSLHDVHLEDGPNQSFDDPVLLKRIGITPGKDITTTFRRTLDFQRLEQSASTDECGLPSATAAPSTAKLRVQISMQVALDPGSQHHRLDPLPIEFVSDDMPKMPTAPMQLLVAATRQPLSENWRDTFGSHWILDARCPQTTALELWNRRVVGPVAESLTVIQRGRPASLIPALESVDASTKPTFIVRYSVYDDVRTAKIKKPDEKIVVSLKGRPRTDLIVVAPRIVTADPTVKPAARTVDATPPRLLTTALSGPALTCRLELFHKFGPEATPVEAPGFLFGAAQRLPAVAAKPLPPQTVRMGALELDFLPRQVTTEPAPRFDERESRFAAGFDQTPHGLAVSMREIRYDLKLLGIKPGGQDDVPGDEFAQDLGETMASSQQYRDAFARRPALVVNPNRAAAADSTFFLSVHETIAPLLSQTIDLRLRSTATAAGLFDKERLLVIDPEPFLIAKVVTPEASDTIALTNEIGNWTNRADLGAGWEIGAGASGFDLVLPPQGLGETMHRRIDAIDVKPGEVIDLRFTPPTIATLQASFFRQRFVEPAWNLRRILGYPGQRAPGAGIDRVQFELLYGMSGEITYPFLRLAEVASRLGRVPGQQPPTPPWQSSAPQHSQYSLSRCLWRDVNAVLRTRLAVLEPYDATRPAQLKLTDADGLAYRLREKADLAYPIPNAKPQGNAPASETGLKGSFAWAFESRNIYDATWRNTLATGGQLTRPFFSTLGGWGHQKATFDNGRTTIYSEVVMGRVSSINVERIGRIGTYWNRAKHVIVYERTVAASRQFYLEQHALRGNPVLRKVDEYVELLEEERHFPDTHAEARTTGPVLACRFSGSKPPRIRVNSRWGEDIGTTGWKIPLWLRGAAPADVYPQPAVHLIGRTADQNETVPFEVDEPEKLWFYTNTEPGLGDDTDAWPAVAGVDFQVLPKGALDTPKPGGTGDPAKFTGRDSFFAPGTAAFTVALAPSPKPVNMLTGRSETAVAATLRNVTMMRGVALQDLPENYLALREVQDALANALAPMLALVPNDRHPFDKNELDALFRQARVAIAALLKEASGLVTAIKEPPEIEALRQRLISQTEFFKAEIRHALPAEIWQLHADFLDDIADLRTLVPGPKDVADELRRRLQALIDPGEELAGYAALLRSLPGTIGAVIAQLSATIDRARQRGAELARSVVATECEICRIAEWKPNPPPPEAQALLAANDEAVRRALGEIQFLLAEVPRQFVGDRLDTLRHVLHEPFAAVETLARALRFDAISAADAAGPISRDDVITRLREIDRAIQTLQNDIVDAITALGERLAEIDPGGFEDILGDFQRALDSAFGEATWTAFDQRLPLIVNPFTEALQDRLDTVIATVGRRVHDAAAGLYSRLFASVGQLQDALTNVFKDDVLADAVDRLKRIATLENQHVRAELERLRGRMSSALSELVNRLGMLIPTPPPVNLPFGLNTLRLLRGFGEPPRLPNLSFPPLPELPGLNCGYYFFDPSKFADLPSVNLTPIVAKANELAQNALQAIEIHLPTRELLDRFKPASLQDFDLSRLFPNFAGLKLDSLFEGLRPSAAANDQVKVTHGVEPQSRSGWVQVDVDVPISRPATVFNLGGITLRLLRAQFKATTRIEAALGGTPRQTARGSITGDWDLQIGSFPIAVLSACTLEFEDGGRITFNVSPDRVKLQQVLAFLADLMSKFGYSEKGFSVAVGPEGVRAILDLPLPDIQSGAFGIANLRLGFVFALNIVPEFQITTQLSVARKTAPFTLTIFVLGGAGWLETGMRYLPSKGEFETFVSIGIMASASLAISLGPIRGGIYAYFGITVDYKGSNVKSSRLTVGLLLLFVGEVSLLGIVSVGLRLGLEAQYSPGGGLVGRGFVSLSIKICWCITIDVQADVQYRFGGAGGSSRQTARALNAAANAPFDYGVPARAYILMFA